MPVSVTLNAVSYPIPQTGDQQWGDAVTNWIISASSNLLQKTGGNFQLSADANFGPNFGLVSAYFKSRTTNPATAGIIRLANNEGIQWRNAANLANLELKVNGSNVLLFNGNQLLTTADTIAVAQGGTGITSYTAGDTLYASGATALSKLGIGAANTVLRSTGSAPAWALLDNSSIASAAGIVYSKLNLTGGILNADISASAAIALSKLAALTASRAVVTDGSGLLVAASSTATEVGYLVGVTSAIQTQLDAKVAKSTLTTKGDLYVHNGTTVVRQAVGADGTFLVADSAQTTGLRYATSAVTEVLAKANTAAGQSISVGTTIINFNNVVKDTNSGITTGGSWHYTVPSNGDYMISGAILSTDIGTSVGALFTLEVYVNGMFSEFLDRDLFETTSTIKKFAQGSTILTGLVAGDTIDLRCSYGGGGATTLEANAGGNYVNIYKIPGS
jgi:hypothetical protein